MPRMNSTNPLSSHTGIEPDQHDDPEYFLDGLVKESRCHRQHKKDLQKIRRSIEDHLEKRRLRDMQDLPFDDEEFDLDDDER